MQYGYQEKMIIGCMAMFHNVYDMGQDQIKNTSKYGDLESTSKMGVLQ